MVSLFFFLLFFSVHRPRKKIMKEEKRNPWGQNVSPLLLIPISSFYFYSWLYKFMTYAVNWKTILLNPRNASYKCPISDFFWTFSDKKFSEVQKHSKCSGNSLGRCRMSNYAWENFRKWKKSCSSEVTESWSFRPMKLLHFFLVSRQITQNLKSGPLFFIIFLSSTHFSASITL